MLKKISPFLILLLFISNAVLAGAGIFAGAVSLQVNGTTQFYNAAPLAGNSDAIGSIDFNSLGRFLKNSGGLSITGAQIKTYKDANGNVCNGTFFYQVRNSSGSVILGTSTLNLPWMDNCNNGIFNTGGPCNGSDQKWGISGQNIDLTGLSAGDYKLEIWFTATGSTTSSVDCTPDAMYMSNGGVNYNATFSICDPISITAQPTIPTVCYGSNTTLTASATGMDAYIWQKQSGASWTNVSNGSVASGGTATLNLSNVIATDVYRCLFTNCAGVNSLATSSVTVTPQQPTISVQPVSQTDCEGNDIVFNVTASGVGTLSYAWQKKVPGGSFVSTVGDANITTPALNSIKVDNIGDAANDNPHLSQYQCIVTDGNGCTNTSTAAVMSVNSVGVPTDQTVCVGTNVTMSVPIVGDVVSYSWQKSTTVSGFNGSTTTIGTNSTLSLPSVTAADASYYRLRVTFNITSPNDNGSNVCTRPAAAATSALVGKLTVNSLPSNPTSTNVSRCGAGTVTLTATSSLTTNQVFRWYADNTTTSTLQQNTSTSYTTSSLAVGTYK